jgi:hypothetical protein
MQHARTPYNLMFAKCNLACEIHQVIEELSFILMGENKIGVFENSREPQT